MECETEEEGVAEPEIAVGGLRARAAAFLDVWERQVSEHARRGPCVSPEPSEHEVEVS